MQPVWQSKGRDRKECLTIIHINSCGPVCTQVQPPVISMRDFEKVMLRARPTVSKSDLEVFEKFTKEFGEEG